MAETKPKQQNMLVLDNRARLSVTGINDVDSFDERTIVAYTDYGQLTIHGVNLNISKLSVESGELMVDGEISSLVYTDNQPQGGNIFKRLFR